MAHDVDLYNSHYGHLAANPQTEVRKETYGDDLGQSSWITLGELRGWAPLLQLDASQKALEVACGSGGATCQLARETGAAWTGVDINVHGIEAAAQRAERSGLSTLVSFRIVDASGPLPYLDDSFDVVFSNDAINHLPDRAVMFRDWHRLLRPGGRVLFTDPIVITGEISHEEVRERSAIGFYLFTPAGYNERRLQESGFNILEVRDTTDAVASVSQKWRDARAKRRGQLVALEGEDRFEGLQRFLEAVHTLSIERRLSRFMYLAVKRGI